MRDGGSAAAARGSDGAAGPGRTAELYTTHRRVGLLDWRRAITHPTAGPRSSTVRHVLLTLSLYADGPASATHPARIDGGRMFPSIETLALGAHLNRETVRRAIKSAANAGWVIVAERASTRGHGWKRQEYQAAVPASVTDEHLGERWEQDPDITSERKVRRRRTPDSVPRHRTEQGRYATEQSRDDPANVTEQSRKRHRARQVTSPNRAENVTEQGRHTSPLPINTSSGPALQPLRAGEPPRNDVSLAYADLWPGLSPRIRAPLMAAGIDHVRDADRHLELLALAKAASIEPPPDGSMWLSTLDALGASRRNEHDEQAPLCVARS